MRRRELIMDEWQFSCKGNISTVNLPHTWNNIDGQDGGNDYYRGTCSYAKILKTPEFNADTELVFLEFDGVNASAKVCVNGTEVALHDGGYSTFRAEVTSLLKAENEIRVEVDNSVNERVYPQKADFTFYGGIYRDVKWLVVNRSHFAVRTFGTPGIFVTPSVNGNDAKISVKTELEIEGVTEDISVCIAIFDGEGALVTSASTEADASSDSADFELNIENVNLWDGIKNPYLYRAVAKLVHGTETIDEIYTDFGVRTIEFDKNKGFILNGKVFPLRGVSRHQDRKGLGNAITKEMMEEDMALIKEVGANGIRLAHYQHNQYFYDLCDREGMAVWSEIPYISGYLKDGDENTYSQMMELIIQNYNHPSIITWGLSNEITIDNLKSRGNNIKNHKRLNDLVHSMDPNRPTSIACFAMCTPFHPVTKIPDVIGWNLYLGWYVPGFILNDAFMWFYHTFFKKPLGYSEYGAEGMPNLHSERPKRGDNTEEYQIKYHEYMLKCFEKHPYLWGTFVWNMFDFAADARNQGGEPGMNHKGLVTFDRKLKKDSFYLYKAYWSKERFVHITGSRFVYRNNEKIDIKVYSNESYVSLYVDGKLFDTIEGSKIFVFKNVPISAATRIEAVSSDLRDYAVFKYSIEKHDEYALKKTKKKNTANWM